MRTRTPLETKTEFNYEMWFKGEIRIMPEVRFVKHPRSENWGISMEEFHRLNASYFTEVKRYHDGRKWVICE